MTHRIPRLLLGAVVVLTACVPGQPIALKGQEASLEPALVPVWKVGDTWSFRYESPAGNGTSVDVVLGVETVDGIECYVIRTGRFVVYAPKANVAYYIRKDSTGNIVSRHVPPLPYYAWPMTVGKQWQESTTHELPQMRRTVVESATMSVEETERVTVPAGTFDTFKIVVRDR